MHVYLFEAKSIQNYLFQSGKLKDVIAASERLDNLIDTHAESVLAKVLEQAKLVSDLYRQTTDENAIYFLRAKGGTFYAGCEEREPLEKLRSLWTLTITQLFPSLIYIDAFSQAKNLQDAINQGQEQLEQDRNKPVVKLPIAPAISERYNRTGLAAIPLSSAAKWEADDIIEKKQNTLASLDTDTDKHRQAYQKFKMREGKDNDALQGRFTPDIAGVKITYPLNFEKEFEFKPKDKLNANAKEAVKDIALIHIDGNGLGKLLIKLKSVMADKSEQEYRAVFRAFSDAINKATVNAARIATKALFETVKKEYEAAGESIDKIVLPMRPIVLGGDDVTLFCRADLALSYARAFCQAFKKESRLALQNSDSGNIYQDYLQKAQNLNGLKDYITASGGILYAKAGHPFTQSNQLVEALCKQAKALTKSIYKDENNKDSVGPAALAIYRVSNASREKLANLQNFKQRFHLNEKTTVITAQHAYFVDEEICDDSSQTNTYSRSFTALEKLYKVEENKKLAVSIAKWRQITTLLAQGDGSEAMRLYDRCMHLSSRQQEDEYKSFIDALMPSQAQKDKHLTWCWQHQAKETDDIQPKKDEVQLTTFIDDLLVLEHFQPALEKINHV